MARTLNRSQIEDLAEMLTNLLSQLDGGLLIGSAAQRHRLQGAATALQVVLGRNGAETLLVLASSGEAEPS